MTSPTARSSFAFTRVRGCDAYVIQSHCDNINTSIMERLIMVDALKRASAERITVVTPFWLRPPGQETSRSRTDYCPSHGRPVQDGWC